MEKVTPYILKNGVLPLLKKVVRRCDRYVESHEPQEPMAIEKFIFSEDSSHLSTQEYEAALRLIEWIKAVIRARDSAAEGSSADDVGLPGGTWNPQNAPHYELDGAVTNAFTSANLVLSGDFEVVRKLRLYSQSFTGYQLATLEFNHLRPYIRKRLPENIDEFLRLIAGVPDGFSRRIPGIFRKVPERLRISPPLKFGEIGWQVDGRILNHDTYSYLVELCLMHENGVLEAIERISQRQVFRVLEIGGGFGGLAYHLMRMYPNMRYAIVDIPESLIFSSIYLATLFPTLPHATIGDARTYELADRPGLTFVPNHFLDGLSGQFDLIINTLSLNEMTENQIVFYSKKVKELLTPAGIFFEHNQGRGRHLRDLRSIIREHSGCEYVGCRSSIVTHDPSFRGGQARLWKRA